jgi:hypothetical protein
VGRNIRGVVKRINESTRLANHPRKKSFLVFIPNYNNIDESLYS